MRSTLLHFDNKTLDGSPRFVRIDGVTGVVTLTKIFVGKISCPGLTAGLEMFRLTVGDLGTRLDMLSLRNRNDESVCLFCFCFLRGGHKAHALFKHFDETDAALNCQQR